jgi:hypothetical protein
MEIPPIRPAYSSFKRGHLALLFPIAATCYRSPIERILTGYRELRSNLVVSS